VKKGLKTKTVNLLKLERLESGKRKND